MKVIVGVEFAEMKQGKLESNLKVQVVDAINQEEALGKFLAKYKDGKFVGSFTAIEYQVEPREVSLDIEKLAMEFYSIFDSTTNCWTSEPEAVKDWYRKRARVFSLNGIISGNIIIKDKNDTNTSEKR